MTARLFTASERGRRVLLIERSNKAGKKILMSGGGRCNFTNMYAEPANFASRNPHFCKSALARYSPWDFIALVERHGVPYHEKKLGQLFCDSSATEIIAMLRAECDRARVDWCMPATVQGVTMRRPAHSAVVITPIGFRRRDAFTRVLDDASAPFDGPSGECALALNAGAPENEVLVRRLRGRRLTSRRCRALLPRGFRARGRCHVELKVESRVRAHNDQSPWLCASGHLPCG